MFKNRATGLDIADHTIEVVELLKKGGDFIIANSNRVILDAGIVVRGRIKDPAKLAEILNKLFASAQPKAIPKKGIVFGFPEAIVYTHTFSLPIIPNPELDGAVLKEIATSIPEDAHDLRYSYRVLEKTKDSQSILAVAANQEVVKEWLDFFKKNNFEISNLDTEMLATYRALSLEKIAADSAVAVVDIGSATTHVGCFDARGLRSGITINFAGDDFDQALSAGLKITADKAEALKIKNGLTGKDGKGVKILSGQIDDWSKELLKCLTFFNQNSAGKVASLVLVGGSARILGLSDYLVKKIKLPISIGKLDSSTDSDWEYLEAVGLAMRALDKKWAQSDPEIPLTFVSQKIRPKEGRPMPPKQGVASMGETEAVISLRSDADNNGMSKGKAEKILLLILLLGLLLLGAAFWYRNYYRNQQAAQIAQYAVDYNVMQTFNLTVPIATSPADYSPDRVRGRIVENLVASTTLYEEAVKLSGAEAQKLLAPGEALFPQPFNYVSTPGPSSTFKFNWLIYNSADADQLLIKGVNELNTRKITYFLQTIEKLNWEKVDNSAIINLKGRVTIQAKELF